MNKASAFEMDALDSRIKELVAYARERDGEDRAALYRNLVDLFLTDKAPKNNPTRSQLLDVLQALIPHVNAEDRRTVCELIANMASPPVDLVLRLAQDRVAIVGNLLTNVQIDDDDLIALVEATGREHHQVIASRQDLSANIWIALARAAPSAPPFDHQSTLALWSDDLGITQTKSLQNEQTIEPERPAPTTREQMFAPTTDDHETTSAKVPNQRKQKSATVTPLHPDKAGSIRILRTDEDLLANRDTDTVEARRNQALDNDGATGASTEHTNLRTPISDAADALQAAEDETGSPAIATKTGEEPEAATREPFKHAQDPGPGGWAWISDRDGFVTSVSEHGIKLLGEAFSPVGTSMLDLLGLNTKVGHPVARAFQRRSPIHDAPIFLNALDEKHQHWTLEATPFFSNCGGIFEGYEGTLTPVVPASKGELLAAPDDDDGAMFLDEVTVRPAAKLRIMPPSFTDHASVLATETPVSLSENQLAQEEQAPVEELRPMEQVVPVAQEQTPSDEHGAQPAAPAPTAPTAPANASDLLSAATTSIVKEALREALSPKGPNSDPLTDKPAPETPTAASAPKGNQISGETQAHVAATLDMLSEAISRLNEAGRAASDPQIRLQSEIAAACIRSLKDQLGCGEE